LFFAIYSFALLVESTICGKVNITLWQVMKAQMIVKVWC
jgi:hypothetical protein